MAEPSPPPPGPPAPGAPVAAAAATAPTGVEATYKAKAPNPIFRMMGLPNLPKKLPSRNWMIFWTITASISAAIIYDKREKKRATARWARAVSHLGKEPISNPCQLPRKLCIYLESPPTDGLRAAQDHYTEFVKPILAASGLDWEFVQGRKEGDVRAAVAEKIRRSRRMSDSPDAVLVEGEEPTTQEIIEEVRRRNGTPEWDGVNGDIVIGRHTWKEYVRGMHEGWLGPTTAPPPPVSELPAIEEASKPEMTGDVDSENVENKTEEKKEEAKKAEEKPARPPQPLPYNTTNDYTSASLPASAPSELSTSITITFPHILGFSNTFTRMRRFLGRRYLADEIGREVAAACLAASREFREDTSSGQAEQLAVLEREEKDWPSSVWQDEKPKEGEDATAVPPEKIWTSSIALDSRIAARMRRFEIQPEDEAKAREIAVPEEEVEGWIKGNFRSLYRWAVSDPPPRPWSSFE